MKRIEVYQGGHVHIRHEATPEEVEIGYGILDRAYAEVLEFCGGDEAFAAHFIASWAQYREAKRATKGGGE